MLLFLKNLMHFVSVLQKVLKLNSIKLTEHFDEFSLCEIKYC